MTHLGHAQLWIYHRWTPDHSLGPRHQSCQDTPHDQCGDVVCVHIGLLIFMSLRPYVEASEQTILQKVVPLERQGRVFGFAQSVEQSASPLTAFLVGPLAEFLVIPFMTTGAGVALFGGWFGSGSDRALALIFSIAGIIGLCATMLAFVSRSYRSLSRYWHSS